MFIDAALAQVMSLELDRTPEEMLRRCKANPDLVIEWALRATLPPEVTFDGLRYIFTLVRKPFAIDLLATFWYLNDGQSLGAALRFEVRLARGTLRADYAYTTEHEYSNYEQLWNELNRLSSGKSTKWSWSQSGARVLATGIVN